MKNEMPVIQKHEGLGGVTYSVYAPNGRFVATFACEHFLRSVLQSTFNLSSFASIPLTESEAVNALVEAYKVKTPRTSARGF